jgi:hypothetical protein
MTNDECVVVTHKLCSFHKLGNKFHGNAADVQILLRSLANSITDPNGVCKLMDCSVMVFVEEFSIFSTFLSFCWCLVVLNVHHYHPLTLN